MNSSIRWRSYSGRSSRNGTMRGGSLTIRGSPSTSSVNLSNALRLSFARALAMFFSNRARSFLADLVAVPLDDVVDGEAGVPDVEVAHRGERRHRRPVRRARLRW